MNMWEQRIIRTDRGSFEIFIKGEGPPVCVTHHYSEFNCTGDYYADVFTGHNKVILVNLKDAGNSDKVTYPYELSMIDAVLDLEEIRKRLGYKEWIYAGHSTGGMIGILYGIHYSNSLKALILTGTAAREYSSSSKCIYNVSHPHFKKMQDLLELLKRPSLNEEDRAYLSKERMQLSLRKPEKYEEYLSSDISKSIVPSRLDFFSREALIYDVTRQLSKIRTKSLILCGKYDVQCPLEFSIELSEAIPDAGLHVFTNSSHYPHLEERETFNRVIHEFLKEIEV
ncbi:alpha/beta fold hydrolase [Pradoshia sp.]